MSEHKKPTHNQDFHHDKFKIDKQEPGETLLLGLINIKQVHIFVSTNSTTCHYYYFWWFLSLIFQVFAFHHALLSVIPTPWTHMVLDVLSCYFNLALLTVPS